MRHRSGGVRQVGKAGAAGGMTVLLAAAILVGAALGAGAPAAGAAPTGAAAVPAAQKTTVPPSKVPAQPSSGCGASMPATPGMQTVDITAGGEAGKYVRELPTAYTGRTPMPLVIDLHGYSETADIQVAFSGLGPYGNTHGFMTVTPEVQEPVPLWNTQLGGTDLSFFGGVLDDAEQTLCVDQRRVFVTGYSNGAFLTSAVACQFAARVAAVAPVAGIQAIKGCHPSRPVPVVAFHGTTDPFVPYTGGIGKAALNLPAPNGQGTLGQTVNGKAAKGPSIPAMTASWARRNGCAKTPATRKVASDVTLIAYRCPPGANVELYRVAKGGHAWPGSEGTKSIASIVGRTTFSISADAIMWRFFQAHPLPHAAP